MDASLSKANEIGLPQNDIVPDESGIMKAFAQQDRALLGSVTIATDKAMTVVSFGAPTHELASIIGIAVWTPFGETERVSPIVLPVMHLLLMLAIGWASIALVISR